MCLWHLTPAVSRRATQDSRLRKSDHWRGRLQCIVRPSPSHRAPCLSGVVRRRTGGWAGGEGACGLGLGVLVLMSWGGGLGLYVLAFHVLVLMSCPLCLGVVALVFLS